jgi:hypothetical protein
MFKEVRIITNTPETVLVEVTIQRRKLARDKCVFVSLSDIRLHLKNNLNLDLSKYDCNQNISLCNYTDEPVLSEKFLFSRAKPVQTVSTVKSSLDVENTNLTPSPEPDKVENKPVTRKPRRRVSRTKKEDKLLGTENLE